MALPAGSDDLPGPGLSLPQQNSPEVPFEIFPSLSVPPVFRGARRKTGGALSPMLMPMVGRERCASTSSVD